MLSGSKSDFIVTRVLLTFFFFTKRDDDDDDDDDGSPFRREEKEEEEEEEEDRTGLMHRVKEEESISVSLLCVRSCVFKVTLCITLVIKVLLIRYMLSTNREKRLKFIQKERKDLLFLGFFEGPERHFFFLSCREKTKSHVLIKRDWQYFCCDHHRLRICRCVSEERERKRG